MNAIIKKYPLGKVMEAKRCPICDSATITVLGMGHFLFCLFCINCDHKGPVVRVKTIFPESEDDFMKTIEAWNREYFKIKGNSDTPINYC